METEQDEDEVQAYHMQMGCIDQQKDVSGVYTGVLTNVVYDIIDEVSLGLCFEIHRTCKIGALFLADTDPRSQREHAIVDRAGVDVFGQVPQKKQLECLCPNCGRNLAASRFAPHLEKCMGMGRNSSRIASRRSQQIAKDNEIKFPLIGGNGIKRESDESPDDDNDVDWNYHPDKKIRRLKKEKRSNSPRRNKNSRVRNGGATGDVAPDKIERSETPDSITPQYEYMSMDERKTLLLSTCGVVSGITKKMCTRTHRCPQHSDEQRRQVRQFLLGTGGTPDDDDQIDIDSYEDGDSQSLRESLQWEAASTTSSPADSTSASTNSSNARKRAGKSGSSKSKKRKHSKLHSSSGDGGDIGVASSQHAASPYDFE